MREIESEREVSDIEFKELLLHIMLRHLSKSRHEAVRTRHNRHVSLYGQGACRGFVSEGRQLLHCGAHKLNPAVSAGLGEVCVLGQEPVPLHQTLFKKRRSGSNLQGLQDEWP